jgi:hypothetical protein
VKGTSRAVEGAVLFVEEDGSVRILFAICGGGGGSAGSTKSTQQTQQVDPWLTKINELAYGQISKGVEATGGLPAYLQANPYALPNVQEKALVGQIGETAARQGGLSGLETQGLEELSALGDPSAQLAKAQEIYEKYAAPIVRNDATVAGQGRQGVVPETLASGFAHMALPIMQGAQDYAGRAAQARLQLGGEVPGREIESLETQLRAAGAERTAQSAEYMRPLQAIAGIVGGLPVGGGTVSGYATGKTSATRGDFDVLGDLIIPLVGAIAGGAAGCWLATAALDLDAIKWRVYVALKAPWWERVAYRVLSHSWTSWLAPVVHPWLRARVAGEVL